jgi:hypothetical protein
MTLMELMKLADDYADACVSECNENFGNSKPREDARFALSLAIGTTLRDVSDEAYQAGHGE